MLQLRDFPEKLKPFVLFSCQINWQNEEPHTLMKNLSLPSGCSFIGFVRKGTLITQLGDQQIPVPPFYFNSQTTIPYYLTSNSPHLVVDVLCLHPTTLYHVFNIEPDKYVNSAGSGVVLGECYLQKGMPNGLQTATSISEFEEWMLQLLEVKPIEYSMIDSAIQLILRSEGTIKIKTLVKKLNVSERYFQKRFKKTIGITPSEYIKIIRFNYLFANLSSADDYNLNSSSKLLNFYDLSHFSKTFKLFFGVSPSKFEINDYDFIKYAHVEQKIYLKYFPYISLQEK